MTYFVIFFLVVILLGALLLSLGSVSFVELGKAMENYYAPHLAGSSVPYPAYDQTKSSFAIGGVILTVGISLLIIQRKRK